MTKAEIKSRIKKDNFALVTLPVVDTYCCDVARKLGLLGEEATTSRSAATRHLIVYDPISNRNFLVDTGAYIRVLPVTRSKKLFSLN